MDLPILLRPPTQDDLHFILNTWLVGLHKVVPYNYIPNDIYFPHQTAVIHDLLSKSEVSIACLDDTPDLILGYLIAQPFHDKNLIVHWAHTKNIYRRSGVLTALLEPYHVQDKNIVCSHFFKLFKELRERYHLIFDPTILERP